MPVFLTDRQPHLIEIMDRDYCDPELLDNTYRQFVTINHLLSQWKKVYREYLRPLMSTSGSYNLLDIGFGGGDIPLNLAKWAQEDGIDLEITAIDIDERAFDFVQNLDTPKNLTFKKCNSSELVEQGEKFDFVISNHVLHHLTEEQLPQMLNEAKHLARHRVIFNDIERSDLGYLLFNLFSRLIFRRSFITADGLTSIKRSFTHKELKQKAPHNWQVTKVFPFRLLLMYDHDKS